MAWSRAGLPAGVLLRQGHLLAQRPTFILQDSTRHACAEKPAVEAFIQGRATGLPAYKAFTQAGFKGIRPSTSRIAPAQKC